jgi:NAD(P)-dependent dehydrogenase (short-subunit alcohol dehydrogenase family)
MGILEGKTAIVSGGGTGIGSAIASRFFEEGAKIVICGRRIENLKEAASRVASDGKSFFIIQADVTLESDIVRIKEFALKNTGRIDILVNNAGTHGRKDHTITPALEMTRTEWDRILSTNLTSAFLFSKTVLPIMIEQQYGSILNISSLAAKTGGLVNGVHYVASKAGMMGLTKSLARGSAFANVRVNTLCLGRFETPSNVNVPEEFHQKVIAQIPMGRLGTLREAANAALFLVSDASSYVTGANLDINGGWYMD